MQEVEENKKRKEEPNDQIPRKKYKEEENNKKKMQNEFVLKVKKLTDLAVLPIRASKKAAGYDLVSAYDLTIEKRGKALVKTDIAVAIPEGHYGRVAPRSSLAWKNHIDVGAGVIDCDYRGNVGVVLFNHSNEDFEIKRGDRIAQLIIEKISTPEVVEVEDLDSTERGEGGFGSTGKNDLEKN